MRQEASNRQTFVSARLFLLRAAGIPASRRLLTLTRLTYSFMFSLYNCAASAFAGLAARRDPHPYQLVLPALAARRLSDLHSPVRIRIVQQTLYARQDRYDVISRAPSVL